MLCLRKVIFIFLLALFSPGKGAVRDHRRAELLKVQRSYLKFSMLRGQRPSKSGDHRRAEVYILGKLKTKWNSFKTHYINCEKLNYLKNLKINFTIYFSKIMQ